MAGMELLIKQQKPGNILSNTITKTIEQLNVVMLCISNTVGLAGTSEDSIAIKFIKLVFTT